MAVPNIFASATSAIPLSQLDQNFATAITLGNTAVYLGNTTTSLGNVTLTNVTISSGNVTLTGANVSGTANVSTLIVTGNQTSLGNVAITGNVSANIATFSAGTAALPAITTTGDTNTGIFFPAADTIAFSEGGAEAARIDSSGNFCLGTNSVLTSGKFSLQADLSAVNAMTLRDSGTTYGVSSYYTLYQNSAGSTVGGIGHTAVTSLGINATTDLQFFTAATERARIDSSGNLGIGTTSPQAKLEAYQSSSGSTAQVLRLTNPNTGANTGAGIQWNLSSSTATINGEISVYRDAATSGTMVFKNAYASGGALTESMRIDSSGNVGIGTASPAAILEASRSTNGAVRLRANNQNAGASAVAGIDLQASGGGWTIDVPQSSTFVNPLQFVFGGTEKMRLDASGNLGLGVTPSAWSSTWKVFQSLGGFVGSNSADGYRFANNSYSDGTNWRYVATGEASAYQQLDGSHAWFNAASGTAGNTISFTQAMTLDTSGRLLVGCTSGAQGRLAISGSGGTTGSGDVVLDSNASYSELQSYNNRPLYINRQGNNVIVAAESGNLLVGTTATVSAGPTSRVISYAGSASTAAISAQYGNSYTGQLYRADSLTTSGTGWSYFMGLSGNGTSITTTQIQILGNGNIQNTNNSYGAISDIKRKENITDATPKLEKLNQVRVVNFNMIGEEQKQLGVIAQELEQVFPSMIEETPDRDVEGNDLGTTTKSVKYSVFVPMLIKAMQEQQALITQLTDRITALEGA